MATEVATLLFEADTRPLKAANDELAKTERAGVRAQDAARKMGTDLKRAANDSIGPLQKVSSGVGALASALVALAGALAVRQFILYTDQWTDLNSRLINATGSAEAANEALQSISQTARTTYSSLQQTAEAFLLNSMALNELGYTTRQQVDLADALNNALVISGTKGERAASVMNALSKAMALGKLSGDNFNSVIQSGGRVVQALADGLGVTTSELRAMAADGLLTTEAIIISMTSQMEILRAEAEEMPATIGDAMVQLGNFALEAVGRLDEAAGLSASIAETIIASLAGWRAAYMPTEQEQFNALLVERVALEERLAALNTATNRSRAEPLSEGIRAEIAAINEKMIVLRDANVERQKAEQAAQAEGVSTRAATEAQRVVDHQAELARIQTEKDAKIRAEEESRAIIRGMKQGGALGGAEGIILEIEAKKKQQDKLLQMTRDWQGAMDAEAAASDQKRIDASASQTEQLISFQNLLLANKSETSRAAATIGMNLMNQEKREAAKKIITDSYAAAMAAYKSLAGIPIIGPALGAVAAGGIIAAGVSYSAKSLAGRALGGQVLGGESYVVGERGPEVLTMGSSGGKIVPNSALSNQTSPAAVNKTANVNFTIMANDARGFDELLKTRRGQIIEIVNQALNDSGRGALV
jgi:tape measure domain-containing protein